MTPCIWKAFYPEKWKLARPRYCTHLTVLHPLGLCCAFLQKRGNKGLSLMFLSRTWGILDSLSLSPCLKPQVSRPCPPSLCFTRWMSAASRTPILAISQQSQCLLTLHRYLLTSLAHFKHTGNCAGNVCSSISRWDRWHGQLNGEMWLCITKSFDCISPHRWLAGRGCGNSQ